MSQYNLTSRPLIDIVNATTRTSPQHFFLTLFIQFFPPDYAPTGQLIDELIRNLDHHKLNIEVFTAQPSYAYQSSFAARREVNKKILIRRSRACQFWPQRIRGKTISGFLFLVRSIIHLVRLRLHILRLRLIGKYNSPNLILLTTAPAFLPILGCFAHILKIPYVILIYDLYPDIAIELGLISHKHWLSKLWKFTNSYVWRRSKQIIALSSAMKQAIIHACPEVADKISTIHSWADPKYITPIPKYKNEFAIEHKLDSVFTVLYSGNMGRCHDIDTILHAAQYLKDYPIQFVFIGGGSKREEFMWQVAQLELSRCMFLPYQSKSILPYSLTACDVSLVSISAGMDAFVAPSKLYSSLSAGRPIVAVCPTDSYLSNLINKANCGAAFNNGDSDKLAQYILQLSSNDRLSKDLGANGRRYLEENFSLNRISNQYFEVFQRAIYNN